MYKPTKTEYKTYFQKYIDLVQEGPLVELMDINTQEITKFIASIPPEKANYRYAPNKWTLKDVFMHVIDTERGFSYRAIVCVRKDGETPLYPMEEDFYAANVDTSHRSMKSLLEEFLAVRKAFCMIFQNASKENLTFLANAVDHKVSARALGYIAIGHTIHHMNVIKDRYL